jgi:hypothetical protein
METFKLEWKWDFEKVFHMWKWVSTAVQLILTDVWLLIQNSAKINAPYKSWTLRRSINTDFYRIQRWIVVVWSPVRYARIRELSNNLHPYTTFYLKRAYTENEWEIRNIIMKNLSKELNN